MKYQVKRNKNYDYAGQSYAALYPNLHKYPATMLPQIGIDVLKEFGATRGVLLDPYCGSGSSFAGGLECGIKQMHGFDINPLAVLISKARFTKMSIQKLDDARQKLRSQIFEFLKNEDNAKRLQPPAITNLDFWFSPEVTTNLAVIKHFLDAVADEDIRRFLQVPFAETARECSFTRNSEFKLFRMKSEEMLRFNPDVIGVYFHKLANTINLYANYYFAKLDGVKVDVSYSRFQPRQNFYDVVLTSPPYGDSRTTVAYGQFSALANEWLGIDYARKIDGMLMGGAKTSAAPTGLIADYLAPIKRVDDKRAGEVAAFYHDLGASIRQVAASVKKGGKAIYVVGNRTVKKVQLPTDQFIAEQFEQNGFKHLVTYERALSNKAMPSRNSPTNEVGKTVNTMLSEYIVVCEN